MAAVDELLKRLSAIDEVVDFASTNPSLVPVTVIDFSIRAAAVQGMSAFEQFIRDRSIEWSAHLTAARVPATRLQGGTGAYSNRIVHTLPRRFKDSDDSQRSALVRDLGATLASFSTGTLVGSDLFFAWSGSNVQSSDIADVVRLVGLDKAWSELTSLWKAVDPRFPGNASAESQMVAFASLRHAAAHNFNATLDQLAISSITRNVKLTSLLVDVAISHCIRQICEGKTIVPGLGAAIQVRTIKRDGTFWPEYGPGKTRARKRHSTFSEALASSAARAMPANEIVVALDGNDIVDWRATV